MEVHLLQTRRVGNPDLAQTHSKQCTFSNCVQALSALRNQEKELRQQQSPGVPHTESDIIPHDMAVVTITEILGERCCRPADKAAKRRRCGPCEHDRARGQEYLVRGFFDGDDDEEGEDSEDDADAVHHSNTYWVPVDVVLETIAVADLEEKLVARHAAMLAHLAATAL